jgi:AraC-like DNA-binding protein
MLSNPLFLGDEIPMGLVFSHKLFDFFKDFYYATGGIAISVFEPPVRVSYYNKIFNYHNCIAYPSVNMDDVFCRAIRNSREIDNLCIKCDEHAVEKCRESGEIYIYRCHLGFYEGLIPVPVNGKCSAMIFVGQVYDCEKTDENFNAIYHKLQKIDSKVFTPAAYNYYRDYYYGKLRVMSEFRFRSMCSMLKFIADRMQNDRLVIDTEDNPDEMIKAYIEHNVGTRITAEKICSELNISRSTLYRRIKKAYGMGFNEYVNSYKIDKAASLLRESNYTVKQTALMVGYDDVNYFSRIFKQRMGISPMAYKTAHSSRSS